MAKSIFPNKKQISSMDKKELIALADEYEIDVDGLSLSDMKEEIIETGEDENWFKEPKKEKKNGGKNGKSSKKRSEGKE